MNWKLTLLTTLVPYSGLQQLRFDDNTSAFPKYNYASQVINYTGSLYLIIVI